MILYPRLNRLTKLICSKRHFLHFSKNLRMIYAAILCKRITSNLLISNILYNCRDLDHRRLHQYFT